MTDTEAPALPDRGQQRKAAVALAVTAALVLAALAADVVVEPTATDAPQMVPQEAARAGAWYCPATAGQGESAVLSVAAVGDEPSVVTVVRYPERAPASDEPVTVSPGDDLTVVLGPEEATHPVSVRWEGGPAVASWRIEAGDTPGAPCEPGPAERWRLAGLDTAAGSRSTIHLFNPFSVDAVARVVFATPEGPVGLVLTSNVFVEAGGTTRLDVNEFQPEQPDLGATVEVLTGRLVVAGELSMKPPAEREGPTGRALIPATAAERTDWSFGYARADSGSSSWLSVMNTGDREAAVEVRVSSPTPEAAVQEQSVPAGGVLRIDLAEMSEEAEFGVTADSVNDVPIVVHRVTTLAAAGREGLAVSRGGKPANSWALVGGGAGQRGARVNVYNPGAQAVTVRLRTAAEDPAEWGGVELGPNAWTTFNLADTDPGRGELSAFVDATGPVVAELRSHYLSGPLRLWTAVGVPADAWSGPPTRSAVRRDPSLSTRPLDLETSPTPTPAPDLQDVPGPPADDPEGEGDTEPEPDGEVPPQA